MTEPAPKKIAPATEPAVDKIKPTVEPIPDIDPFNPAVLRTALSYEAISVTQQITALRVGKAPQQEFWMTHSSEDYRADALLLEVKADRDFYLVHPAMKTELEEEAAAFRLHLAIGRSGVPFLLAIRLPGPDGKWNSWPESLEKIALLGRTRWVRAIPKSAAGMYVPLVGSDTLPGPDWPELPSMRDLLRLAFGDRLIDTADHPVIRRLRGLA
jgi:hypothetical protein